MSEIVGARGVNDEVQRVAEWLKKLVANGYRPGQVAVFARKRDIIQNRVYAAVKAAGLEAFNLEADEAPPANRVAVGTMHRSKGLQFRAIAVMGVEEGTVPLDSVRSRQPDEAAQRAFVEMERNLLYVACSRARERGKTKRNPQHHPRHARADRDHRRVPPHLLAQQRRSYQRPRGRRPRAQ